MRRLALVSYDDLVALLDYAQPDEERDVTDPDNDNSHHVVYPIRRLREQANTSLWEIDSVQFARLLAEILATIEITNEDWAALRDSMDLEDEDLQELFNRAQSAWDTHKAAIPS